MLHVGVMMKYSIDINNKHLRVHVLFFGMKFPIFCIQMKQKFEKILERIFRLVFVEVIQ